MNKPRQFPLALILFFLCANNSIATTRSLDEPRLPPQSPVKQMEKERERAHAREQFTKNFRDLQLLSQGLLREHERARLTSGKLAKDARSINKCARTLRTLIALGEMANEVEINKEIDTAQEFDESIRKLSKLVRDFAHNPVHQSNKVFNTDQAERAQTDLLTIINLSKALEDKSKNYSYDHRQHGQ
jgi:hypothetical protein